MSTHDTSGHEVRHGESMTTGMRQGDDTAENPGHGKAMANVRISTQPGEDAGKYMPDTIDHHRTAGYGMPSC